MIETLNIKNYQMGRREVLAPRGLRFQIAEEKLVTIMGPSGSGKSPLNNIFGYPDASTFGQCLLDGAKAGWRSHSKFAVVWNSRIYFVFESYKLLLRTSALANVELPLLYRGARNWRRRAFVAAERVTISRHLLNDRSIIPADEPTGNLDSRYSQEATAILKGLTRKDGSAIGLVTHEQDVGAHTEYSFSPGDGPLVDEQQAPQGGETGLTPSQESRP